MKFINQDEIISVSYSAGFVRSKNFYNISSIYLVYLDKGLVKTFAIKKFDFLGQNCILKMMPICSRNINLVYLKFYDKLNLIKEFNLNNIVVEGSMSLSFNVKLN